MPACPHCGRENPDDARFCSGCGASLATEIPREERKVVSVLFADLVGFTSRAERMDPEDVRALLSPYHGHLREELERYGGTVEKFIGDAVMALFGAPVAHEDDAERAVRAALTIRDWAREAEGELQLRIAVATGEALIALGARPGAGEGMASGDVVNTASRLQGAAPVDGIIVDETTYRATSQMIEYRPSEPVKAKGKVEPVRVWEALEARSRFGVDTAQRPRAPLVGRDRELETLVGALARVREDRSPQLVTLVGVPGIGKTRLVFELFQAVEADPELIYWRQGGSLPYGEGVSFWALGEMVKAHAGILETDSHEETDKKLRQAIETAVEDAKDAAWVVGHLRPVVGIAGDVESFAAQRAEAFAAWRRFFESLAEDRPLVLVFEDLHWADEGLLDFIDHLIDWAVDVPILVVCTARPELLSLRPDWGGGKPNAATLSLSPLSDEQTARLLAALLERSVLPAETQAALLQRAGGNPLYAEEFVRMVADRSLSPGDGELPLPESVQGIVAARLDALTEDEKVLLQDAAVVGKVFWLGAATEIAGVPRPTAQQLLHGLERKEFVRRERRSSVADETEYAFRHLLVRDVAYAQIPRARRAEKHRLAAGWVEALGRTEDHAEMVAHHYLTALELARAAGAETAELAERARLALRDSGDRASRLGAYPAAKRSYGAALDLWPADDPDRPALLLKYGRILMHTEVGGRTEDVFTEARDSLLGSGDVGAAAEAEILLGERSRRLGVRDTAVEHFSQAEALVRDLPPSPSKANVLGGVSRFLTLAGDDERAIRLGREALAMATELGLDELRAHALNNIGTARVSNGDLGGFADLEESIAISLEINSWESVRAYSNLASHLAGLGELERSFAMNAEARELAKRFGLGEMTRKMEAERVWELYVRGRWEEALALADELIADFEEKPYFMEGACRQVRGCMRLAFGDLDGAQADATRAIELARVAKDPQLVLPALAFGARAFCGTDPRRADELAGELLAEWRSTAWNFPAEWLVDLGAALVVVDRLDELLEAAGGVSVRTPWLEAAIAFGAGEFRRAAEIYDAVGHGPEAAYARLRAAEALVGEGRRAEADAELQRSLAFWRSVGATAYIREGEALLAASA
jgi:class 3 adenylate cyclase/tetratricopeptide (TPR) repeat protein